MTRTKEVKFYYFKLIYIDQEVERDINLSNFFNNIRENYINENDRYVYEYQGENAKLSYVSTPVTIDDFYQLTFERLRDFNYPVRARLTGDSRPLDLEEGEFLGEEVTALFDHRNNFMMLQNNRDSLSYKAIELFLNWLISNETEDMDGRIVLKLAVENNPGRRVQSFLGFREVLFKMNLSTFNVDRNNNGDTYDFLSALKSQPEDNEADNLDVEIKITVKNKPSSSKKYMAEELANEALSYQNENGLKKLQVKGYDARERLDTVNLIENKLTNSYRFNFRENRQLRKDVVYDQMKAIYLEIGREKLLRN